MIPANYPITIRQGTSFSRTFKFFTDYAQTIPFDFTDYTVKAQVRLDWNKSLNLELEVSFTEDNDGIDLIIDPQLTVRIAPDVYQWDILIVSPTGKVDKPIKGDFTIEPTQTHL